MKLISLIKRLDFQLSSLIGIVAILWFVSFWVASHWIENEREQKRYDLETEHITTKIQSELTQVLNDILLEHTTSLNLTVKELFQSLSLSAIELKRKNGDSIVMGSTNAFNKTNQIHKVFPIEFNSVEYGTLEISKEYEKLRKVNSSSKWYLMGMALALIIIFVMVREFILRKVMSPLTRMIAQLNPSPDSNLTGVEEAGSIEMQMLSRKIGDMKERLLLYQDKVARSEKQVALGKLAAQVAHDIRSPLAALSMVNDDLKEVAEEKRVLVRSAVNRINDIANHLLEKQHEFYLADGKSIQLITALIDNVLSEKRMQFRSRLEISISSEFDSDSYGVFSKIEPKEFKRAFSNILNNAVEAIRVTGSVNVRLFKDGNFAVVRVSDNGIGIKAELLPLLMKQGATFGKSNGSGMGLYYSHEVAKDWGGKVLITSEEGKGTKVNMYLPIAEAPKWFLSKIELNEKHTIVILDDDLSVHYVWQSRFDSIDREFFSTRVSHYSEASQVIEWHQQNKNREDVVYLIDYELLGQAVNGLQLIQTLGISKSSTLVTSHYEEKEIQEECTRSGISLLPKSMAACIPISLKLAAS